MDYRTFRKYLTKSQRVSVCSSPPKLIPSGRDIHPPSGYQVTNFVSLASFQAFPLELASTSVARTHRTPLCVTDTGCSLGLAVIWHTSSVCIIPHHLQKVSILDTDPDIGSPIRCTTCWNEELVLQRGWIWRQMGSLSTMSGGVICGCASGCTVLNLVF